MKNCIDMNMLKQKKDGFSRFGTAVLFVYIFFVLWGQYALIDSIFPPFLILVAGICLSAFLTKKAIAFVGGVSIGYSDEIYDKITHRKLYFFYFGITILILTLYFIARYPGVHCFDTMNQLQQVADGEYNDWHPAIQTFLALAIPYKLFGLPGTTYVQIIFFSAALAYMMSVFYRYKMKKKLRILVYCLIMLNPITGYMMMFPWKDSTFAILTLLLAAVVVELVYMEGKKLESTGFLIFVSIVLSVCTLVRHNAILFTAPFMLLILFLSGKNIKRGCAVVLTAILLITSVKCGIYKAAGVEKPNQRVVETVGMCMVMMGNAYVNDKDQMSTAAAEFLESVRDSEIWDAVYKLGDWNYVKNADKDETLEDMDALGAKQILEYTLDTLARCPEDCLKAFLACTGMVWKIDGSIPWSECLEYYDNDFYTSDQHELALEYDSYTKTSFGDWLETSIESVKDVVKNSILKYLFYYTGIYDLILLIFSVGYFVKRRSIKSLLIVLPVFAYNFGTALLLSGYDWRFFYYMFPCFFSLMFAMQKGGKESEE